MARIEYRGDKAIVLGPVRAEIDRAQGTLVYEGRNLPLADVAAVHHEWLNVDVDTYAVKLVLADTSALMLELLRHTDERITRAEATALAAFLDLPLDDETTLMERAVEELAKERD